MIADYHQAIIDSVPDLAERLERAGVQQWLATLPTVVIDGRTWFVMGGDRIASEPEAMLSFAAEHGLVSKEEFERASSEQPLPPDVETADVIMKTQGEE